MIDTFPFQTPRGLLSKARRELDQLLEAVEPVDGEPNRERIGDLTMNLAWTLWHVTDWIANNSKDSAVARIVSSKGITTTGRDRTFDFQQRLRDESSDLRHCWELATLFKHFELEEGTRRHAELEDFGLSAPARTEVLVSCFPYSPNILSSGVGVSTMSSVETARPSAMTGELPRKTLHPKIQHDGERLRLTEVYGRAYDYLDRLLKQHDL